METPSPSAAVAEHIEFRLGPSSRNIREGIFYGCGISLAVIGSGRSIRSIGLSRTRELQRGKLSNRDWAVFVHCCRRGILHAHIPLPAKQKRLANILESARANIFIAIVNAIVDQPILDKYFRWPTRGDDILLPGKAIRVASASCGVRKIRIHLQRVLVGARLSTAKATVKFNVYGLFRCHTGHRGKAANR